MPVLKPWYRRARWLPISLTVIAIIAISLIILAIRSFGTGRWWAKAEGRDIDIAIRNQVNSDRTYARFHQAIQRAGAARPVLDYWNLVPASGVAHGTVEDGHYRLSLVARTRMACSFLGRPVQLADYVGDADFTIHNGSLGPVSLHLRDLDLLSRQYVRLTSFLRSTPPATVAADHPGATLELLDARACSFRTAKLIERLYARGLSWPELAERFLKVGSIPPRRDSPNYRREDHFTLASETFLGIPQVAWITGNAQNCRICVLATQKDPFGESLDGLQSFVALEQAGDSPAIPRDVLRLDSIEFDPALVNLILAGGLPYARHEYFMVALMLVAILAGIRYVLSIATQAKALFGSAQPKEPMKAESKPPATEDDA